MRMDAGEADGDGHTKRERERTGAMVLGSSAAGASAHVDEVFADDDNDEAAAEADRRRGVRWRRQHLVAGVGAPADVDGAEQGRRPWMHGAAGARGAANVGSSCLTHFHRMPTSPATGCCPRALACRMPEKNLVRFVCQHNGASNANGTWSDSLDHERGGAWSTPKESYRFSKPVGLLWSVYHVSLTFELFANRSGAADSA